MGPVVKVSEEAFEDLYCAGHAILVRRDWSDYFLWVRLSDKYHAKLQKLRAKGCRWLKPRYAELIRAKNKRRDKAAVRAGDYVRRRNYQTGGEHPRFTPL